MGMSFWLGEGIGDTPSCPQNPGATRFGNVLLVKQVGLCGANMRIEKTAQVLGPYKQRGCLDSAAPSDTVFFGLLNLFVGCLCLGGRNKHESSYSQKLGVQPDDALTRSPENWSQPSRPPFRRRKRHMTLVLLVFEFAFDTFVRALIRIDGLCNRFL